MRVAPSVRAHFDRVAASALEEDLGGAGPSADITTASTVDEDLWAEGTVLFRRPGVVCGLAALEATFGLLDAHVSVEALAAEGVDVRAGAAVATVHGPARALLTGERSALNVISRLSGIATLTREFVQRAPGIEVTEIRKTTPGLRALEKYAVRVGGGTNHRFALWDGVLIKDNHIVAAGGVTQAVRRARGATTLPVEVECETPEQVSEALEAGADEILLDNQDVAAMRAAVVRIRAARPDVRIEASGGVTLDRMEEIASAGIDRISVGALTHSAPAIDVSFELGRVWRP